MSLLDQLAEAEVPPPPETFRAEVHQRVNTSLIVGQLVGLFVRAMPYALVQFGRAAAALMFFSVTGRYGRETKG